MEEEDRVKMESLRSCGERRVRDKVKERKERLAEVADLLMMSLFGLSQ